jgi:hypothetical protein
MPRRVHWAWIQLVGGLMGLPVVLWTSHAYVAHEADEVTLVAWSAYAVVVGLVWGLVPIVTAALLGIANLRQRLAKWLGLCGALQACILYFLGLWVFTFRYPPHWSLYAMETVAAVGALLALTAGLVQMREMEWGAAQQ